MGDVSFMAKIETYDDTKWEIEPGDYTGTVRMSESGVVYTFSSADLEKLIPLLRGFCNGEVTIENFRAVPEDKHITFPEDS